MGRHSVGRHPERLNPLTAVHATASLVFESVGLVDKLLQQASCSLFVGCMVLISESFQIFLTSARWAVLSCLSEFVDRAHQHRVPPLAQVDSRENSVHEYVVVLTQIFADLEPCSNNMESILGNTEYNRRHCSCGVIGLPARNDYVQLVHYWTIAVKAEALRSAGRDGACHRGRSQSSIGVVCCAVVTQTRKINPVDSVESTIKIL